MRLRFGGLIFGRAYFFFSWGGGGMLIIGILRYVTIAVESQFKQLRSSPKKSFSGLQRDSNPWPLRSRCSALPAEL